MTLSGLAPAFFASALGCSAQAEDTAPSASADALAMARLARGDVNALGELYDRHQASVRRFATRMTGSADDGDDLVHATFLAALRTAEAFDTTRSARAWLLGITARLARRQHSNLARWSRLLTSFRPSEPNWAVDPEGTLGARQAVERGLARLSEAKRGVLLMAEIEGLSGEEIAEALELPIGTVWTRLHHARRELSAILSAEERP